MKTLMFRGFCESHPAEVGLADTVAAIEAAGGRAKFVAADLGDLDSVRRLAEAAGEVDILVNNAGAFPFAPTLEHRRPPSRPAADCRLPT
jgi:NAD(P)-dependent dehydrogenase (short-subunit alcohol dehydrogenase family)